MEGIVVMAKYKDFDDDYIYDDEEDDIEYYDKPVPKKNTQTSRNVQSRGNTQTTRAVKSSRTTQNRSASQNRKPAPRKKKKKMKRWVLVLIFVVEIIVMLVLIGVWYVVNKLSMIEIDPIDRGSIVINDDINDDSEEVLKGYTNILLLGSDARDNTSDGLLKKDVNHTDAIIIASINNETKEVKLVSIYRDTMLQIPECDGTNAYTYDKATEAMFRFGVESTISMVNKNCDLDIKDYVMVNWNALIDIIDAVGGIDIEINDVEKEWINKYLVDTSVNTGRTYTEVTGTGMVHLDGIQATAYCRIRYGGGDDYRRTERQRTVIGLVVEKAKHMNISELNSAINAIFGNVATSISMSDMIGMAKNLNDYTIADSTGFPFEHSTAVKYIADYPNIKDPVWAVNLSQNVTELHKYLFDEDNYVSSATVQSISQYLSDSTGLK